MQGWFISVLFNTSQPFLRNSQNTNQSSSKVTLRQELSCSNAWGKYQPFRKCSNLLNSLYFQVRNLRGLLSNLWGKKHEHHPRKYEIRKILSTTKTPWTFRSILCGEWFCKGCRGEQTWTRAKGIILRLEVSSSTRRVNYSPRGSKRLADWGPQGMGGIKFGLI